ncbi:MAG: hypothetical protein WC872_03225, partial [Candidatus Absconditabacterales bacterium]
MFRNIKKIKSTLRYILFISLICWIFVSIYIGYQYIWHSGNTVNQKGGTFVEGIFQTTSFLPYLSNDYQSKFYQGFLFDSCKKYDFTDDKYYDSLCFISTEDNQTYFIQLGKGFIRSDGTPVSIDDVFFTYSDVVQNNKRNIPELNVYKNLKIIRETEDQIKITFSTNSKDNKLFFTNYILPKHILENYDISQYKQKFSKQPVYTRCANILSQSTDPNSLIFNLFNCDNSSLNFYQIKTLGSFVDFKNTVRNGNNSIVDAYIDENQLKGYITKPILTNKIITLFFNTQSTKLPVRTRRVLGGLIKHNCYTCDYQSVFVKNNDGLFDAFQSTGANAKDFLNRSYSEDTVISKEDLADINVKTLPLSINVKGENQKFVFFVETGNNWNIDINFDKGYDRISIESKGNSFSPQNYNKKIPKIQYSISTKLKNFSTGLNKYIIYGYQKKDKKTIASIDLYNFLPQLFSGELQNEIPKNKIKILYYNDFLYNFVIQQLKSIFASFQINDYFDFIQVNNLEDLQTKLSNGDYDIFLTTIDMGLKKDMTNLFNTDQSAINPSKYQNQKMVSFLQQYINSDNKSKYLFSVNDIYAKNMPFVILGNVINKLNIKPKIAELAFGTSDIQLYEYNRREK